MPCLLSKPMHPMESQAWPVNSPWIRPVFNKCLPELQGLVLNHTKLLSSQGADCGRSRREAVLHSSGPLCPNLNLWSVGPDLLFLKPLRFCRGPYFPYPSTDCCNNGPCTQLEADALTVKETASSCCFGRITPGRDRNINRQLCLAGVEENERGTFQLTRDQGMPTSFHFMGKVQAINSGCPEVRVDQATSKSEQSQLWSISNACPEQWLEMNAKWCITCMANMGVHPEDQRKPSLDVFLSTRLGCLDCG